MDENCEIFEYGGGGENDNGQSVSSTKHACKTSKTYPVRPSPVNLFRQRVHSPNLKMALETRQDL